MNLTSAPFIHYSEITTDDTDIYEDAWGFTSEFSDVFALLEHDKIVPSGEITERLTNLINRIL
ncbi:MAG: hypothetical protein GYA43_12510, partial [Bacteroidales bacterium]|nr:hypothetical protein [Bacteroidales bacterium]